MSNALLGSRIQFYDENQSGKLLNRFGKDSYILDDVFPHFYQDFVHSVFYTVGILIAICVINPLTIILIVITIPFMLLIANTILKASVEIRRVDITMKAPVLTLLASCAGSTTSQVSVRCFGAQKFFEDLMNVALTNNLKSYYCF
jgi:ABC-type multidrug transport system fused ATPase/permease subunit